MGEAASALHHELGSFLATRDGFLAKQAKNDPLSSVTADDLAAFPFLAINQRAFSIVHVEVDDVSVYGGCMIEPAFDVDTFESLNIPLPNYSVISSGHKFHAFWLMERSLPKAASYKSLAYYHDVRAKLVYALGGDRCCNIAGAVRNPFYKKAEARQLASRPYRLGDLNLSDVKVDARSFAAFRAEYAPGSRNCSVFQALLRYAQARGGQVGFDDLVAQAQTFMALTPDVEALPVTEVRSIASSVARNSWRYRARAVRNYGAMSLPPVDYEPLEREERVAVIRSRQAQGASYVNEKRRAGTMSRLVSARDELLRDGQRITQAAVAERSGLSLATVKRGWKQVVA